VLVTDVDLVIVELNRLAEGITREQSIGQSALAFIDPEYQATFRAAIAEATATRRTTSYEVLGASRHGQVAWYETRVSPIVEDGQLLGFMLAAFDATRMARGAPTISESEEQLAVALRASGLGLWAWERAGDSIVWDQRVSTIHGVAGAPKGIAGYRELVHPDDRPKLREALERSASSQAFGPVEMRILRPDGKVRWVYAIGRVLRSPEGKELKVLGGVLDVTERHELEERLRLAQKMEAVGQLTAGVAHNFNNMLMAMLPTLELAERAVDEPLRGHVREAIYAGARAAEMVRQLMTFSRARRSSARSTEQLPEVVQAAVALCDRLGERKLSFAIEAEPDLPPVSIDAGQIEQALVNILLNARDSVLAAGREQPSIRVKIGRSEREGMVSVSVEDNGLGMGETVRERIFEPFFTTKEVGQGTGLGLATAYGIVEEHGGRLECSAIEGEGARFTLSLPAAPRSAKKSVTPAVQPSASAQGERVLVVDDEVGLRSLVQRVLEAAGYEVDAVDSAEAAFERLRRAPTVDLVLLDRSVSRGPSKAVVASLRELAPRMAIVYFTGASVPHEERALVEAVLNKPATLDELLELVRRVLDRPAFAASQD
jgi:two-component system, cell cycle sensor histidine kinase and response regulator CckA